MSQLLKAPKALYFLPIIYRDGDEDLINKILEEFRWKNYLSFYFPDLPDSNSPISYYEKEMGKGLKRIIIASTLPECRSLFVDYKVLATKLEKSFGQGLSRRVNIDVGVLNSENMQLASGKMYSHRVYLKSGVYSDLHYTFEGHSFVSLAWTYPDYKQVEVINFFNYLRAILQISH